MGVFTVKINNVYVLFIFAKMLILFCLLRILVPFKNARVTTKKNFVSFYDSLNEILRGSAK